jgi:diguanylate cyclase (GGDEF)-like protein
MKYLRRGWSLLLLVVLFSSIVLACPAYYISQSNKNLIAGELGKNAINIAATVAAFIEQDIEAFESLPVYEYSEGDGLSGDSTNVSPEASAAGAGETDDPAATDSSPDSTNSETDDVYNDWYDDTSDYWSDDDWYDDSEDDWYDDSVPTDDWYDDSVPADDWYDDGYEDSYDDSYDGSYGYNGYDGGMGCGPVPVGFGTDFFGQTATDDSELDEGTSDEGSFNEEYFNQLTALFDKLEDETGAENIYCERKISETKKGYVFSGDEQSGSHLSGYTADELTALSRGISTASGVKADAIIGEYITGYAPIAKTGGTIIGLVVVEYPLKYMQSLIYRTQLIILISFIVIMVLASFVIFRLLKSRVKYHSKDDLTELCNKRFFERYLKILARKAKKAEKPLALMMIDVDDFKQINDHFGHITGDNVLRSVSQIMLKYTRRTDACCRYGGDEFAIILPNTDNGQAKMIADRILNEMLGVVLYYSDGRSYNVSLSIGITQRRDSVNAEALLHRADQALYASKNSGKNMVTCY